MLPPSFETHPSRYRHWQLDVDGKIAQLTLQVDPAAALDGESELKLNSYDLGVDIELHDAVRRLRFSHPEVRGVLIRSGHPKVFCAGANIPTLRGSSHMFKVNFCKFTNETRLYIEEASGESGQHYLAALRGATAGGGYELAMACERIVLVDDGNSAISLPEVPLLGVLPGTGGLTRLVDKRGVRPDHADMLCTSAEGIAGERALRFKLCDKLVATSKFEEGVQEEMQALLSNDDAPPQDEKGIELPPLESEIGDDVMRYRYVEVKIDRERRVAELVVRAPEEAPPETAEALVSAGADNWAIRAFRELDDALLRLRFHHSTVGVWVVRTQGNPEHVVASDRALAALGDHWLARETRLLQRQVLRRLDTSARSVIAVADEGACFAGVLLEIALGADRCYALDEPEANVTLQLSVANAGAMPTWHGRTRLELRTGKVSGVMHEAMQEAKRFEPREAEEAGLATVSMDEIDFEDELRIAIEERASLSPDALTAMEANLRCVGDETWQSKIFSRLSAWQNWVFTRPNATGPTGALTRYGAPEQAEFDLERC